MRALAFVLAATFVGFGAASAQPATAPADYSDGANWLCRPGRGDACAIDLSATIVEASGAQRVETAARAQDAAIDCFYV